MKGYTVNQIAAELDIKRPEASQGLRDWQSLLRREAETSTDLKDRVMTVLFETDKHWKEIIKRAWETVEQADNQGSLGSKNQALKIIAGINKDRINIFQQAGLNEDTELVEQLNEQERQQEILIKLLREIKEEHPEVAQLIARRLSEIQSEVEVVEIESGE